jgi:hypothetical protein
MVEHEASIRETAVFVSRLSAAQAALALASSSAEELAQIKADVMASLGRTGDQDLKVQIQQIAREMFYQQQLINVVLILRERVDAYRKQRSTMDAACDDNRNFDAYDIRNLDFRFVRPDVETIDGVYVSTDMPIISTLVSLWQVMTNTSEQDKIAEQSRRLAEKRATTADYRRFAVEACRRSLKDAATMLLAYDQGADLLKLVADSVDVAEVRTRLSVLIKQLAAFDPVLRDRYVAETVAEVKRTALERAHALEAARESVVINTEINQSLIELDKLACGVGRTAILKIEDRVAASSAKGLPNNTGEFLSKVQKTLRERAARCGGRFR